MGNKETLIKETLIQSDNEVIRVSFKHLPKP